MPVPERTISVVLTDDLIKTLRSRAAEETITISAVVRHALRAYFSALNDTQSIGLDTRHISSPSDSAA